MIICKSNIPKIGTKYLRHLLFLPSAAGLWLAAGACTRVGVSRVKMYRTMRVKGETF